MQWLKQERRGAATGFRAARRPPILAACESHGRLPVPDLVLGLEAAVAAALGLLGLLGTLRPRAVQGTAAGLCAAGAVVAFAFLLTGAGPQRIAIPLGLPGFGMILALDGLSGFFLLLVLVVGAAAATAGFADPRRLAAMPPLLGAMVLCLLAGDGFALVLGFAAMCAAAFAVTLAPPSGPYARRAALRLGAVAVVAVVCLIGAVTLLGVVRPWGIDLNFDAIRTHPPDGWRAGVMFLLVLVGAGSQVALPPLHAWLPPVCTAAPAAGASAMAAAMAKVALYALIRLAFDLAGPAQPGWWSVPLIALGAAGAVLGAARAAIEGEITGVLGAATICHAGLIAVGLGVALTARAADLPALASLALGGALLHAVAHALSAMPLFLAAGAVAEQAGTLRLARLGGLIHFMPMTTLAVLAGAAALAALPPSVGFAGAWMLLQAALAALRIGGLPMQALVAIAAALMALALALTASASVRLVGIAFLGRPRSPRAAGAQDPVPTLRTTMLALAGLGLVAGLFPPGVLLLERPGLLLTVGEGRAAHGSAFMVAPQADAPGYVALAVAVLLGLGLALAWLLAQRRAASGHRTAPAWDGGSDPPPAWLPFGDPLTQVSGAGFARPVRDVVGGRDPITAFLTRPGQHLHGTLADLAGRLQSLSVRRALAVAFATLVLLLVVVAVAEQF
jgi:hydrogenase-4 component B